ncbi:hypothetical protein Tco_0099497 [Tanacetum coccineum]
MWILLQCSRWSSSATVLGYHVLTVRIWSLAMECRKPNGLKTPSICKEKMMLCKQAEKGRFLMQTQHALSHLEHVETDDSNVTPDSPDMCDNDIQNDQNDVECDDERVALANLIANLKLDVDENKKIQKQLKKANATLTQELTECKSILAETSRTSRGNIIVFRG